MPFDPNLDQTLFSETKEFERTRVTVAVHQYNEGEKKLQLSRENSTQAGEYPWPEFRELAEGTSIIRALAVSRSAIRP